jgi:hypothetical protein
VAFSSSFLTKKTRLSSPAINRPAVKVKNSENEDRMVEELLKNPLKMPPTFEKLRTILLDLRSSG